MPRAILLVMDTVGCGGATDAAAFGDEGANTLGHIAGPAPSGERRRAAPGRSTSRTWPRSASARHPRRLFHRPAGLRPDPPSVLGRIATEVSRGKDTPSGHWELAGVPVPWDWHYFPRTDPGDPRHESPTS